MRQASSYGLGEQVKAALDAGVGTDYRHGRQRDQRWRHRFAERSAHDSGVGRHPAAGSRGRSGPAHIQRIDLSGLDPRLQQSEIQASCDVTNPLLGEHGATGCMGRRKARTRQRSASWRREWRIIASCLRKPSDSTSASGPAPGRGRWGLRFAYTGATLRPGIDRCWNCLTPTTIFAMPR